ncbi:MAG TPA: tRNA lysidine(34) synthetase TilS [Armatimonadota bacterium]|nr:tRNA lysidine(34) synthetase TilS [Armatimonadota bacterium]
MLLDIVARTVETYRMLGHGDRVLVAVSGGPDSVALLDVLVRLRPEYDLDLHVAHLDHKLRPEAAEEAEFVGALAGDLRLPVTLEAAEVRALAASEKLSLEHAARNARREFLLRTAKAVGAARVALGHHADDRVETVLMRILRGTGIDGLAGMRPVSIPFIRPLFDVTRAQIMAYIEERALPYREDPSNRDPAFLRNRVRRELLPLLEQLQPGCKRAILRLSELAEEQSRWLQSQARMAFSRMVVEETPESVTLKLASLSRGMSDVVSRRRSPVTPSAAKSVAGDDAHAQDDMMAAFVIPRRVVREAIRRLLGDMMDIEQGHVEAVLRLAHRGRTGARVYLPRRIVAERGYRTLVLRVGEPARDDPVGEFALTVPGETDIPSLGIAIAAELLARDQAPNPTGEPPNAAQLDYGAIEQPVILRTWRRGDRFQPLGMTGSVKVHDLFVNHKVPRAERERVPIITAGGNIAWIVGLRVDERFKVSAATETVLRLEARRFR